MSFWSAVVAIVAILAFTATRIARYRAGLGDPRRRGSIADGFAFSREGELQKDLDELRKRVAVLERIATEDSRSHAVAAEIERLRDTDVPR